MKAGLAYADIISTVSPTYSKEIQTSSFGNGMEVVLTTRKEDVHGILNGVDYSYWNPQTDKNLKANYSSVDVKNKIICKRDLQEKCGFALDDNSFIAGCVSRFDNQKGFDLIMDAVRRTQDLNIKFAVLGSGDRNIRDGMLYLQSLYPQKVRVFNDYNEALAHQIYAGSDIFLMPSRFEPCGLSQIISLAYGTVPVVNKTGGLADTITDFDKSSDGNGFVFDFYAGENLVDKINTAYNIFNNKNLWSKVVANAFASNYSWDNSVLEYENMYNTALNRRIAYTIYK
jgi:starch synthase